LRSCDRTDFVDVRAIIVAVVLAGLLPGIARGGVTLVSRDLPLGTSVAKGHPHDRSFETQIRAEPAFAGCRHRERCLGGGRSLAAYDSPRRFDLVGLHWRGPGRVSFRTRALSGRWSAWHRAAPEAEDGPDRTTREARRLRGWRLGSPFWTGGSDGIEYRTTGRVTRLQAKFVRSPVAAVPNRALSVAGSPSVLTRKAWGAIESIRRGRVEYAPSVRLAIVHHTAGSNNYTRAQSPAIVRAIEVYHVKGNGWNDIGYNFLVDKYGQVFEGRYGGMQRNVIGAHAEGFNTGSVGVSLLGSYDAALPSPAALSAITKLIAWRLDVAHVDPTSTLTYVSNGNPRFPAGVPVFMRAVSGHRDTGFTSCPGNQLYRRINALAATAGQTGLPKLYAPRVTGRVGGEVRFTGRLSQALPWRVAVSGPSGVVASAGRASAGIDWTWNALEAAPTTRYAYTIEAPHVRGVRGLVGRPATTSPAPPPPPVPPPPLLAGVTVTPPLLTPNGDGADDRADVAYRLAVPATVLATVVDSFGVTRMTVFSGHQNAGAHAFTIVPTGLLPGVYSLVFSVVADDGRRASDTELLIISA
jgi:N-acetylmuramoyl-L-alanine amidase